MFLGCLSDGLGLILVVCVISRLVWEWVYLPLVACSLSSVLSVPYVFIHLYAVHAVCCPCIFGGSNFSFTVHLGGSQTTRRDMKKKRFWVSNFLGLSPNMSPVSLRLDFESRSVRLGCIDCWVERRSKSPVRFVGGGRRSGQHRSRKLADFECIVAGGSVSHVVFSTWSEMLCPPPLACLSLSSTGKVGTKRTTLHVQFLQLFGVYGGVVSFPVWPWKASWETSTRRRTQHPRPGGRQHGTQAGRQDRKQAGRQGERQARGHSIPDQLGDKMGDKTRDKLGDKHKEADSIPDQGGRMGHKLGDKTGDKLRDRHADTAWETRPETSWETSQERRTQHPDQLGDKMWDKTGDKLRDRHADTAWETRPQTSWETSQEADTAQDGSQDQIQEKDKAREADTASQTRLETSWETRPETRERQDQGGGHSTQSGH